MSLSRSSDSTITKHVRASVRVPSAFRGIIQAVSPRITATIISDPLEWNQLVVSFSHYSALQGWGFGEVRRVSGWTPHRLKLMRDGIPFAAAQVLRRKQTGLRF